MTSVRFFAWIILTRRTENDVEMCLLTSLTILCPFEYVCCNLIGNVVSSLRNTGWHTNFSSEVAVNLLVGSIGKAAIASVRRGWPYVWTKIE